MTERARSRTEDRAWTEEARSWTEYEVFSLLQQILYPRNDGAFATTGKSAPKSFTMLRTLKTGVDDSGTPRPMVLYWLSVCGPNAIMIAALQSGPLGTSTFGPLTIPGVTITLAPMFVPLLEGVTIAPPLKGSFTLGRVVAGVLSVRSDQISVSMAPTTGTFSVGCLVNVASFSRDSLSPPALHQATLAKKNTFINVPTADGVTVIVGPDVPPVSYAVDVTTTYAVGNFSTPQVITARSIPAPATQTYATYYFLFSVADGTSSQATPSTVFPVPMLLASGGITGSSLFQYNIPWPINPFRPFARIRLSLNNTVVDTNVVGNPPIANQTVTVCNIYMGQDESYTLVPQYDMVMSQVGSQAILDSSVFTSPGTFPSTTVINTPRVHPGYMYVGTLVVLTAYGGPLGSEIPNGSLTLNSVQFDDEASINNIGCARIIRWDNVPSSQPVVIDGLQIAEVVPSQGLAPYIELPGGWKCNRDTWDVICMFFGNNDFTMLKRVYTRTEFAIVIRESAVSMSPEWKALVQAVRNALLRLQ